MEQLLTYVVLGLVGIRLLSAARYSVRSAGRQTAAEVMRTVRWRDIWTAPLLVGAVSVVAGLVLLIPGMDWGWWTALGGDGNPITGTTDRTVGTVWEWLVPAVFLLLITPALPLFALAEERIFRRGAEDWSWPKRVVKVVTFGLVHALVGVPIGVALALSIGGAWFMGVYLRRYRHDADQRAAMFAGAAAHTAYNGVILVVLLVVVILTALGVG